MISSNAEFNGELYELLNDVDVVQRINIQRQRCLGHVVRMEEDALARRVFDVENCESWRRERPCFRWKDQIEEALSSMGVNNGRRCGRSKGAWRDVLRQDEILLLLLYFPLLTGRIVFSNKNRNLRKYLVVFFKHFGGPCIICNCIVIKN